MVPGADMSKVPRAVCMLSNTTAIGTGNIIYNAVLGDFDIINTSDYLDGYVLLTLIILLLNFILQFTFIAEHLFIALFALRKS